MGDKGFEEFGYLVCWHVVPEEAFPLLFLGAADTFGVDLVWSAARGDELVGRIKVVIENFAVVVH